ncbi:MAG: DMT family transporter [Methanotrichaceae archaeon]
MKDLTGEKKEHYIALSLMILTVVFWGLSIISTKIVLAQIPPVTIGLFRYSIASAALIPIALYTNSLKRITWKDLVAVIITSLLGIVLYFIFENNALLYTTASNASMLVAAMPIFAIIIEMLFFQQRANWRIAACIMISIIGVYFVVTGDGHLDFSSSRFYGNLLMMGSMICWVAYTFLNKYLDGEHSGISIITYQSLASIFLFVPFVLPEIERWPEISSLTPLTLENLVFLGIFCSAFEYLFYIYAVKRLGATVSATFLNLIPVVTVISGYVFLQEKLLWIEVVGMCLIMASIYVLNRVTVRAMAKLGAEEKPQLPAGR